MKTSRSIPLKLVQKLTVTSMIGAAVLALTAVVSPDRAWANLLLISFYLITLGLGGAPVHCLDERLRCPVERSVSTSSRGADRPVAGGRSHAVGGAGDSVA